MERETRFELATSTLARLHSTTELFPLLGVFTAGTPEGIRTPDLRIRSPLLYPAELQAPKNKTLLAKKKYVCKPFIYFFCTYF